MMTRCRVGSAVVVEELIVGAQLLVDLAHVLLNDGGDRVVVLVAGLTVLEEHIAVLVRTAHDRMLGVQGALAERLHRVHIHHILQIVVIPDGDLLDLVGGTETVKEVDEGDAALDGGQMGHGGQVHDLLHIALCQHGKAGLAAGHDVGVVAEDVQRVGGHGTGRDMEHAGQQLAGDLVHVGDHQQQALRGSVGAGHGTGGQRAVNGAGGTGLGLHLADLDRGAKDILTTRGGPLVHIVGHGAGGGDGVDTRDLGKGVGYMGGRCIAVHRFQLTSHETIPPCVFSFSAAGLFYHQPFCL